MIGTPKYPKKKVNIRLPKIRGFAIDSIQIVPNNPDYEPVPRILSNQKSVFKEHKSTSPNLHEIENPSNHIVWKLNKNSNEKLSSTPSQSENTSISSIGKYFKSRQNSLKALKNPRSLNLSHCDSCNVSKSKLKIFSTKSSKLNPSLIQLTSNRIKKCLFQIKGSL